MSAVDTRSRILDAASGGPLEPEAILDMLVRPGLVGRDRVSGLRSPVSTGAA